jgi:hypothetical protein
MLSGPPRRSAALAARALLVAGMVAFAVGQTVISRWKALGLQSEWGFDLTFFHNLVWNVTHGHGYRQSGTYHEPPGIFGETHFEPILLFATLPYRLAPGLDTLFAVQACLLALGAWGVYRLVRAAPTPPLAAALAGWIYLLWWPVWRMAEADLRPLTWSLPFLLLLAASLREEKHWESFLWGLLACLCREEVPALVVFLCAGSWLAGRARFTAVRLALAAIVFLGLSTALRGNASFYIQPARLLDMLLGNGGADDGGWGHTAGELLPVRLDYLRQWLVPVGVGALLAPEILLGALPLFGYLFTQQHEWATWEGPYVHHAAPAVGIVAAAAAAGWPRLLRRAPPAVGIAVLVALLGAEIWDLHGRWERVIEPEISAWLEPEPRVVEAHRLADRVPVDASVMADWHTVHLFSGRAAVYAYHQESPEPEELEPPPDGSWRGPLLPRPEVTPQWALVHRDDDVWRRRCLALGFTVVEEGQEWTLLRAPDSTADGGAPPAD